MRVNLYEVNREGALTASFEKPSIDNRYALTSLTRAADVCTEKGKEMEGGTHGRLRGTVIRRHAGEHCNSRQGKKFLAGWPRGNEATGSLFKRQRALDVNLGGWTEQRSWRSLSNNIIYSHIQKTDRLTRNISKMAQWLRRFAGQI